MSHEDFKKIIDSARQILVGKLPNPQDQIDAITYAMMYKFMGDIDDRSASLPGGKRTYFADDYEKYSWHNLMRADGQDQLILYREAIEKMSKNPGLPVLFREIFNGAMLKFNDPRTLRLFLKEVDRLTHGTGDHIGDAYEYLLSLMSSQGGLGQFRTPRHIIKFIVDAVDPDKDDKIIDPAAGTAGFLIAAYEHILHKHDGVDDNGKPNKEKRLSSAELDKIHDNFRGFDIDATMIRTARVNMYLHGFKTPDIIEHDSLSSEDYWSDRYDVILANPPFMTPKGGIQPHKKFSISASRAEILFVDYIIDHLKPGGRAGFVVPSSVSVNDNASYYREARKKAVENGLVAIIELHDSVFKPYAEVTTHIYIIDKSAKNITKIPFIKVHNDGFDKSDTRKPITGSELPTILAFLKRQDTAHNLDVSYIDLDEFWNSDNHYLAPNLNSSTLLGFSSGVELSQIIEECKEKTKEQDAQVLSVSNKNGFVIAEEYFKKRVASVDISNYKLIQKGYFAYNPSRINVGSIAYNETFSLGAVSPMYQVFRIKDESSVDPRYLISILKSEAFLEIIGDNIKGATRKVIKLDKLKKIMIPLPTIEEQREIVDSIRVHSDKINILQREILNEEQKIKSKIANTWRE